MLTVFFNHLGGRIPKVNARNRPIAGDSPWKREIFRAAKFPFKIKSNAHLTARLAEFFRAKKVFAQENQFIIFDWDKLTSCAKKS